MTAPPAAADLAANPGADLGADIGADIATALAACPHYLVCGGCTDLAPKADILPAALRRAGFTVPAIDLHTSPLRARRRMHLAMRRTADGVALGLHRHRSHDIIDLAECRVLHPALARLLPPLRHALARSDLLRQRGETLVNLTDTGPDILFRSDAEPSRADRARLADVARAEGIARITHAKGAAMPETLAQLRIPEITFSGHKLCPPPGAFLQATEAGEATIRAAVLAGLPARRNRKLTIAELYAGCGTLTFALAEHGVVDAYEGEASACAALRAACHAARLSGRINPSERDLARQPLAPAELARHTCLVLDPPETGAAAQIAQIAAATPAQRPARILYVSCGPDSLSRDAAVLRRAGYALLAATAIDQFIGTPRVESVCVFTR